MALKGLEDTCPKLILFGGKGGVGKTTCASAAGLHLAKRFQTLLFSTDPAHSLADSLGQRLCDRPQEIEGVKNLSALEANADNALSQFKTKHERQIRKILDTGTNLDSEDIDSVLALSIPGMDEVMGLKTMIDLIDQAAFDKYVVDTAPTGHALRLLTSPRLLDDWVKVMAKMRWKYRYMVETFAGRYDADEGDDFLLTMKKTIRKMEDLLRDRSRCEFVAVTIPEDMAISETTRLLDNLARHAIPVTQLVINNVLQANGCGFCRERRRGQDKCIEQIKRQFNGLKITTIPLRPHDIKGRRALEDFASSLFN